MWADMSCNFVSMYFLRKINRNRDVNFGILNVILAESHMKTLAGLPRASN